MATDNELRAAGFSLPGGGDFISGGDDAISDNARAAADYAERFKLDYSANGLSDTTDRSQLGTGIYAFWNGDYAAAAGMPNNALGTLIVNVYGTGAGMQLWIPRLFGAPELWLSTLLSGGWTDFQRIDAGSVEPTLARMAPASLNSYKTAPLAMTLGYGGGQRTGSGTSIVTQYMPAAARRVRVHIRNRNPRYNMGDSATVNLVGVRLGLHDGGAGNITDTIPMGTGDGATPYTSGWVDVPDGWEGNLFGVRYNWSGSGSVQNNIGTGFTWDGSNYQIDQTPPLFVWLEVEVPATTPVIGAFGDSLASGVGSGRPVIDSWPDQWARDHGAIAAHWSHSGDTAVTWTATAHRKWWLYGDTIAAPDAMVYAMGSNDLAGAATAAEVEQRITDTVALIREQITPNIYGSTILPRSTVTEPFETKRRTVNDWMDGAGLFRDVFPFATAVSDDDETLDPAIDADGIHLTAAGYTRLAGTVPDSLIAPPGPPADYSTTIPLTDSWNTTVDSEVTAYRSGNVVTVTAWRLAVNEGVTGEVEAYSLPAGYRPVPLFVDQTIDSRGAAVYLGNSTVTITDPPEPVSHHSFTFITADPPPTTA